MTYKIPFHFLTDEMQQYAKRGRAKQVILKCIYRGNNKWAKKISKKYGISYIELMSDLNTSYAMTLQATKKKL